jgi:hypothetical protein
LVRSTSAAVVHPSTDRITARALTRLATRAWPLPKRVALGHGCGDPIHAERVRQVEELGATTVAMINNSGADPHAAIAFYGGEVLPKLGTQAPA